MDDPLAKFRKEKPAALSQATLRVDTALASGLVPYEGLLTKDKNRGRLDLRVKSGFSHAIAYQHLYEIVYDRKEYKKVYLLFNALSATLEGRNLKSVVDAVRLGSAEAIIEWDETEHEAPTDESQPFIERLTILSAAEVRARKAAQGD